MTPAYSIIIPHYNIPDLLMRCLASIPVREDVQVIVVDDNSPDADSYLDRYPGLSRPYLEFVRTTKGGGAGYARNVGLDRARGKWLVFADADDFFVEDFGQILDENKEEDAEIIYFFNRSVKSEDVSQPADIGNCYNDYVSIALETGRDAPLRYRHWVPWGKIISRELVMSNGIRFEEIPYSNDIVFCATAGCLAHSIKAIDRDLYVYNARSSSLSNELNTKPGELAVRAKACFRYQRIVFQSGFDIIGRYPISDYLIPLYHQDRALFNEMFSRLDEIGCSRWAVLRQMRGWEKGLWKKALLYLDTLFL